MRINILFASECEKWLGAVHRYQRLPSTDEAWVKVNITNVMSAGEPCHETIETQSVATVGKRAVLALQNTKMSKVALAHSSEALA